VNLPDMQSAATAVAEVDGVALIALADGVVWEVATGSDWLARRLEVDVGAVYGVAAGAGEIAAATDSGLLWRAADGTYRLFDVGAAVTGVAFSTNSVGFMALAGEAVVELVSGAVTRSVYVGDADSPPRSLTVDTRGHAWVGDGEVLTGVMLGDIVGFDEEGCAPSSPCGIMESHCGYCHLEGSAAPKHDFSKFAEAVALADDIIQRVSTGNMPLDATLPDPAYEALLTWYITGQNP